METQAKTSGDYMRGYQPPWALDPARTALIVVDMQYATGSRVHGLGLLKNASVEGSYLDYRFTRIETVVTPTIKKLLETFRIERLPVIYLVLGSAQPDYSDMAPHLRDFTRAVGNIVGSVTHRILKEVAPVPGEVVLRKTTVGGFASTDIHAELQRLQLTHLVICGISTSYCVDQTARDAADLGYRVLVVEDGVAENEENWHRHSLHLFHRAFGRVANARTVVAEIISARIEAVSARPAI